MNKCFCKTESYDCGTGRSQSAPEVYHSFRLPSSSLLCAHYDHQRVANCNVKRFRLSQWSLSMRSFRLVPAYGWLLGVHLGPPRLLGKLSTLWIFMPKTITFESYFFRVSLVVPTSGQAICSLSWHATRLSDWNTTPAPLHTAFTLASSFSLLMMLSFYLPGHSVVTFKTELAQGLLLGCTLRNCIPGTIWDAWAHV